MQSGLSTCNHQTRPATTAKSCSAATGLILSMDFKLEELLIFLARSREAGLNSSSFGAVLWLSLFSQRRSTPLYL